ncbi:MAG TPA: sugar transferase [Streptosporangiaceae bacterium]|nr:sugar transferase [Streptosporangiaceae bacterium]
MTPGAGTLSTAFPSLPFRTLAKRAFDFTAALILTVITAPLLVAIAIAVQATTPGPALFAQTRIGRNKRPFTMRKFRTMYAGSAEADGVHRDYVRKLLTEAEPPTGGKRGLYKLENDQRITRIGKLLRRTSIDELPQLFNVLAGDMSLVGPRPALPWEAELISEVHDARFDMLPGITGLWQVSGRNRLTMREGLDLDVEYVLRHNLGLDMLILLRTVPTVLSARGAS